MWLAIPRNRFTILPSPARSRRLKTIRSTSLAVSLLETRPCPYSVPRRIPGPAQDAHPHTRETAAGCAHDAGNMPGTAIADTVHPAYCPVVHPAASMSVDLDRPTSAEGDHSVIKTFPTIHDTRQVRVLVVKEVEIVADQLHLVERVVDR